MSESTAPDGETTIIGGDTHFKGELSFERSVRIDGRFEGHITGQGELHVTEHATCKADIDAASIKVDGRIEGNLRAKDTVRVSDSGVVKGDIVAGKMIMSDGATLFGQCAVGPDAVKGSEAFSTVGHTSDGANGEQPSQPPEQAQRPPASPPAQAPGQAPANKRTQPQYQRT